jgi:exodeoxyribonuclease VII small subunit
MASGKVDKEEKKLTVEEAFAVIDEKIKSLEREDISLEDSFKEYREGMELLKYCHQSIEEVEQQVLKIAQDGSLEDFE